MRRSGAELLALLVDTLMIQGPLAEACLYFFSVDPFGALVPLFATGLWHRPLVASRDGQELMLVASALVWGSLIRRAERWLQIGGSAELSGTNNYLRFEAAYRERLDVALRRNTILADASSGVASIAAGQPDEEIDATPDRLNRGRRRGDMPARTVGAR